MRVGAIVRTARSTADRTVKCVPPAFRTHAPVSTARMPPGGVRAFARSRMLEREGAGYTGAPSGARSAHSTRLPFSSSPGSSASSAAASIPSSAQWASWYPMTVLLPLPPLPTNAIRTPSAGRVVSGDFMPGTVVVRPGAEGSGPSDLSAVPSFAANSPVSGVPLSGRPRR